MKPHRPFRAELQFAHRRVEPSSPGNAESSSSSPARREASTWTGPSASRRYSADRAGSSQMAGSGDAQFLLEEFRRTLEVHFQDIEARLRHLPAPEAGADPVTAEQQGALHQVCRVLGSDKNGPDLNRLREDLRMVIGATEKATYVILEAAEHISRVARSLKSQVEDQAVRQLSEEILGQAVRVFEGCGFQDLTGQRINRVIGSLNELEQRIQQLATRFVLDPEALARGEDSDARDGAAPVGPSLSHDANVRVTQEEVDRLFVD